MTYLNPKEKQALKTLKKTLTEKLGRNFISLSLYGSKARGDHHKESDIDVLIITRRASYELKKIIHGIIFDIEFANDFKFYISPTIFSLSKYQEMSNPPTSFVYTIRKDLARI